MIQWRYNALEDILNTTSLMAEIVVIGFFASIWIVALVVRPFVHETVWLQEMLTNYESYAPLGIIALLICWYQLGWILNGICWPMMDRLKYKKLKEEMSKDVKGGYRAMCTEVYQHASTPFQHDLYTDRSVMRISRTGIVNFALIGISVLLIDTRLFWLATIFFSASVACTFQAFKRSTRYYAQIYDAYHRIATEQKKAQAPEGELLGQRKPRSLSLKKRG